jgi:hypothetical protein
MQSALRHGETKSDGVSRVRELTYGGIEHRTVTDLILIYFPQLGQLLAGAGQAFRVSFKIVRILSK